MAFPTFRINFSLYFLLNLKISSFALPHSWRYRISYLSTRKVVSVENLTGLFPSTWVTLETCGDKRQSQLSSMLLPHHGADSYWERVSPEGKIGSLETGQGFSVL